MKALLCGFIALIICHQSYAKQYTFTQTQQLEQQWSEFIRRDIPPSTKIQFPFFSCFERSAIVNQLPLSLLLAVARGESDFKATAISKANAIGIMQIRWPVTAKHLGITNKKDLFNPCVNINAGAKYIKELLTRYHNNAYLALAAYNYGPGRIGTTAQHNSIPNGAKWYSHYIYQHLEYISATNKNVQQLPPHPYKATNKIQVVVFNQPYRAQAFTQYVKSQAPELNLSWFKKPSNKFHVVVQFDSEDNRKKSRKTLKKLGFNI
jgi:hypothetical protein